MLPLVLAAALAPSGADLEWSAPADCPPGASVQAAAAALLGRPLAAGDPAERVRAHGTITREARGFRLDLEVRGTGGVDRRTLRDHRCQVLTDAAALIVAAAVDPTLAEGPPALPPESSGTWPEEPDPSSMSESPAAPAPASTPAPPPEPLAEPALPAGELESAAPPAPKPPPDRVRASLRVAGLFDQGSLPGPTGGVLVAVGAMRRAWRVELALGWLAPRVALADASPRQGAYMSLWTAAIRACGVAHPARRLELAGCGALESGAMVAAGFGFPAPRTLPQPWLAVAVGPELAFVPRPRVAVTLGVDAVVPLLVQVFTIDHIGAVFRGQPAAFRALLGVQLRFP